MSAPRLLGAAALAFVTALQIYFSSGSEVSWRDNWWDALQTAMPRDRGDPADAPAVIIAIDEETMKRTQRWPWPRDQLAELLRALTGHGVKVVAFDIFLDERDPQSPSVLSRRYRARGMPVVASSLARLEDSDITLARAFNESREAGTEVVEAETEVEEEETEVEEEAPTASIVRTIPAATTITHTPTVVRAFPQQTLVHASPAAHLSHSVSPTFVRSNGLVHAVAQPNFVRVASPQGGFIRLANGHPLAGSPFGFRAVPVFNNAAHLVHA